MIFSLGNPPCLAHIPNFAFQHLPPKLKKDVVKHLLEFVSRVLFAVDTLSKCARMLASLNPLRVGHRQTTTTTRQGRQILHCQQHDQCNSLQVTRRKARRIRHCQQHNLCNSMWTANKCTLLRFISVIDIFSLQIPLHCWFLRLFCFLSSYME